MLARNSCNVTFTSAGKDVVSGVTIANEVYLSSCSANNVAAGFNSTVLVSADNSGIPGDVGGEQPVISADGRFVAFVSTSTNLPGAPGGGLGAQSVYVRDTCTGATSCAASTAMVSLSSAGNPIPGNSQGPAISDDGRFVVFSTQAPAPGGGLTNTVFLRDTCNSSAGAVPGCIASTSTISQGIGGASANGPSKSGRTALSSDGRFVVFDSSATNLVTPATSGNQVFVRDTCESSAGSVSGCTPKTVLISVDGKGNAVGGSGAAISGDGHFAAFENETTIFQIFLAATGF
jgi:Tol biopolymer transport system component